MATLKTDKLDVVTSISINGAEVLNSSGNGLFTGDVTVQGDLFVSGTTTTINTELQTADRYVLLNSEYTGNAPVSSGLVLNINPDPVSFSIVDITSNVISVGGTDDPSSELAAGDFILVQNPANSSNAGVFEVLSVSTTSNTVTIDASPTEAFSGTGLVDDASIQGVVIGITLTVMRADAIGVFGTATGSSAPLTFNDILTATSGVDFFNVGSSSVAVATGDFAAGDGAKELFWDASAATLSINTDASLALIQSADSTGTAAVPTFRIAGGAGHSDGGDPGDIQIVGGPAAATNDTGGVIVMAGGTGNGTAAGGSSTIQGGFGGSTAGAFGGGANLYGGAATGSTSGRGGEVQVKGGTGGGTGLGGAVNLSGGIGGLNGNSGEVLIRSGQGGGGASAAGNVTIDSGLAGGNGGGNVWIGATNAAAVLLGKSNIDTTVRGGLICGLATGTTDDGDIRAGDGTREMFYDASLGVLNILDDPSRVGAIGHALWVAGGSTGDTRVITIESANSVSSGHSPIFQGIRHEGTLASPTATLNGTSLVTLLGGVGTGSGNTSSAGRVAIVADGNASPTSAPGKIIFGTTLVDTLTITNHWEIGNAGHITALTDDTYNIGAAGALRPKTLYLGTSLEIGEPATAVGNGDITAKGPGQTEFHWDASLGTINVLQAVTGVTKPTGIPGIFAVGVGQTGFQTLTAANNNFSYGSVLHYRGRGTPASPTYLVLDDFISANTGFARDAAGWSGGTGWSCQADSNHSSGDLPTKMNFAVISPGSSASKRRLRLYSSGGIGMGGSQANGVDDLIAAPALGDIVAGDGTRELHWDASANTIFMGAENATSLIRAVDATSANTKGGSMRLESGTAAGPDADGGDMTIRAGFGTGSGVHGAMLIGTTNASAITIGSATVGTKINGWCNVGSATGAVALGDFAAGDGTHEFHWDASENRLNIRDDPSDASPSSSDLLYMNSTGAGYIRILAIGGASGFTGRRANGNFATKTAVLDTEVVIEYSAQAYDGSAFVQIGKARFVADGAQSGASHPGALEVLTTGTTGSAQTRFKVNAAGGVLMGGDATGIAGLTATAAAGDLVVGDGTHELHWDMDGAGAVGGCLQILDDPTITPLAADRHQIFCSSNSTVSRITQRVANNGSAVGFWNVEASKGTLAVPLISVDGDRVFGISAAAYTGASYKPMTQIVHVIDGTVTATATPGKLTFETTPAGTIATVERMAIRANGDIDFGLANATTSLKGTDGGASVKGGSLSIEGGGVASGNANGGDITVTGGAKAGSGIDGTISIGTATTSALTFGAGGSTITLNQAGDLSLGSTFIATSIVGALNELNCAVSQHSVSATLAQEKSQYVGLLTGGTSGFTITLPPTPQEGDIVWFKDEDGNAATNNVVLDGNGNAIDNVITAGFTITIDNQGFILRFANSEWRIF